MSDDNAGRFRWHCANQDPHEQHGYTGDGYYGENGYVCDGAPPPLSAAALALDAIDAADPERAHALADTVLLESVPEAVREAYQRLMGRCGWWASA